MMIDSSVDKCGPLQHSLQLLLYSAENLKAEPRVAKLKSPTAPPARSLVLPASAALAQ